MSAGLPDPQLLAWDESSAERGAERRNRRRYIARQLSRSPTFIVGASIAGFWIVAALGWRVIAPRDPFAIDAVQTLSPPSWAHWFGTDDIGRDGLSRVLAGAAPVLTVAPLATLLGLALGTMVGLVSGYYRGIVDDVIMRVVDAFLSFPTIIIGVAILALVGASKLNLILAIAILFAPLIARTVRSSVLIAREREFVEAAKLRGEGALHIMFVEILPNITAPIIVEGTIRLGYAVFTAATLAFLGFGAQPPSPDWGLTIAIERVYVQQAWWTVIFPSLALASLVVGINLMADGLRRALTS
jgi:peptide/nickel transport system permease protein